MGLRKAEFGRHARSQGLRVAGFIGFQCGDGVLLLADERHERLTQAKQVPVGDVGLLVKSVAALVVGVVADVRRVVAIEKLEGAVVQSQAQDAHVVGVHHTVAKADRLPVRHHLGGAPGHGLEQRHIGPVFTRRAAAFGVKMVNHIVGQRAQLVVLLGVRKMLKVAKAHKAGRHAGDHGGGFLLFAPYRGVRAGHAQGAGGGNAQSVHGLAAQKLADGAAQHRAAVAPARIRRGSGAL